MRQVAPPARTIRLQFDDPDARRAIFPTDYGQLLFATMPPLDEVRHWRTVDHRTAYLKDMRSDPVFAPLVTKGRLTGPVSR